MLKPVRFLLQENLHQNIFHKFHFIDYLFYKKEKVLVKDEDDDIVLEEDVLDVIVHHEYDNVLYLVIKKNSIHVYDEKHLISIFNDTKKCLRNSYFTIILFNTGVCRIFNDSIDLYEENVIDFNISSIEKTYWIFKK